MKWYEAEDDMKELSKRYPEYWFLLYGEGEDRNDIWKAMFHNGVMQKVYAEIYFPDIDKNEMIEEANHVG